MAATREMVSLNNITAHLSLICAGVILLMATGQLLLKRRTYKNWVTFGLFFNIAMVLINSYLFYSAVVLDYPYLMHLHIPFFYAMGPFLYMMYKIILTKEYDFNYKTWFHFTPAIIATGLMVPYYARSDFAGKKSEYAQMLTGLAFDQQVILFFIGGLILLGYLTYMMLGLTKIMKWRLLKSETASSILLGIVGGSLLACLLLDLSFVTRELIFMAISTLMLNGLVMAINLIGRRYPEFFQNLQIIVESEGYSRSLIEDLDLDEVKANLEQLMNEDKIFREEDLTLARLSQLLGISSHQLSQYLNEKLQRNFSTYINEYRIAEAKHLLKEEKEATVLNIAYRVGFNSKSAFNKAFRKLVTQTPSEFRRA